MSHSIRPVVAAVALALAFPVLAAKPAKPAAKPTAVASPELELGHNLSPAGEALLQGLVDRFNADSSSNMKVTRIQKGGRPVDINLVTRYDMAEVLAHPKSFIPLHEMMAKAGESLNLSDMSADLKAGVVDAKGRLVALPVAYSTPVLFYNKNAFRKAKLDPEQPPMTWFEMQGFLDKLQDAGYSCPYTSSWPVWVHIDNVSAVSGVPAMSEKGVLTFNGMPQVKHLAMMTTWVKAGYYQNFGRRNEGSAKFQDGECAMITTDSREAVDFREAKGVELGVAPLPFHDDVYGGRQHTLADGASLWVGAGQSAANYKQAAKFIRYMLKPDMQVEMVSVYGQMPLTPAARAAARSKILKKEDETLAIAYQSTNGKGALPAVRVANIDPIRIIANEELEAAWADKKPPKAALDAAVSRGNAVLNAKSGLKKSQPF